jgi:sec-independent protein translocase protein TatB
VLDINAGELLVIALLAVILVGPERLPEYVNGLKSLVKRVRALLSEGRTVLRDEFGDDVDWSQYDPRQYDPRRIVREALAEEPVESPRRAARTSGQNPVVVAAVDPDATPPLGTPVLTASVPYDPEST